ncbi:MAG TPA: hypothetical protein VFN03_05285 [Trueperaceae bacterium]|nr:hypothetical protein [Trueperaceae bacterium]
MRQLSIIGVILIVLGIVGFVVQRVSFTQQETALEVGPLEVTTTTERSIPIPDIAAGAAVVAGLVLVFVGSSKRN